MAIPPIEFSGKSGPSGAKQDVNANLNGKLGGSIYNSPSVGQIAAIAGAVALVLYVLKRAR